MARSCWFLWANGSVLMSAVLGQQPSQFLPVGLPGLDLARCRRVCDLGLPFGRVWACAGDGLSGIGSGR